MKKKKWIMIFLILILLVAYPSLVTMFSQTTTSWGIASTTITQAALIAVAVVVVFLAWRKGGKYRTTLIFLVIASLAVWSILTFQTGISLPKRYAGCYYYVWYDETWQTFNLPDEPTLGRYKSNDETVIAQHLTWAKDYGVDFLVVSLWKSNFMPVQDTFNNTKLIFEKNKEMGNPVKLCAMIEPTVASELNILADEAWSLVGYESYLRWYGKPLLFVYTSYISQFAQWQDNRFTVKFVPTEVPYFTENMQTTFVGDAISVKPGANVSYVQVDRQNGKYYTDQWEFAVAWGRLNANRDLMVVITSFNEWYEQTQISPSTSWSDPFLYLKITKQYADAFRKVL